MKGTPKEMICEVVYVDDMMGRFARPKEELIRCKDCKYWQVGRCNNSKNGDGHKYYHAPIKSADGYCDWAGRMKND